MARETFLRNLDKVAGFLSPALHANGIRLGRDAIEKAIRNDLERRGIWPLAQAVEGYDPADFPDLDPGRREELERAVREFREYSIPEPGRPSASRESGDKSLSAFVSVLTLMLPYLDGFDVYAALKRQPFPEFVRDFAVKVGKDSTGDPAAWVWVVVDDREAGKKLFPHVRGMKELVSEALYQSQIPLWPYVLFRTESEQAELESARR